jgi:hypothetical protein
MYDSNEYRNGKTRYMHDVLGQDGNLDWNLYFQGNELTVSRSGSTQIPNCGSKSNWSILRRLFFPYNSWEESHFYPTSRKGISYIWWQGREDPRSEGYSSHWNHWYTSKQAWIFRCLRKGSILVSLVRWVWL